MNIHLYRFLHDSLCAQYLGSIDSLPKCAAVKGEWIAILWTSTSSKKSLGLFSSILKEYPLPFVGVIIKSECSKKLNFVKPSTVLYQDCDEYWKIDFSNKNAIQDFSQHWFLKTLWNIWCVSNKHEYKYYIVSWHNFSSQS